MNFTTVSIISTFFGSLPEKERLPPAAVSARGCGLNIKFTMIRVNVHYDVGGDRSLFTKIISHLVLERISKLRQHWRFCHVS